MSVGSRPALNYSDQTGEQFAHEFMQEIVVPRQPLVLNNHPNYMNPHDIQKTSPTGSASRSDSSHIELMEKNLPSESARKASNSTENIASLECLSRTNISGGFHSSSSSGVRNTSSAKMRLLCSFGGKLLPCPGDGVELTYVGGDSRVIEINKDISWEELMQTASAIYNQTHTIKYQLPGEDIESLVSVSCDGDVQNMVEKCKMLEPGGLQNLRIFLFSSSDVEDARFGTGIKGVESDSDFEYALAENGMDLCLIKNSTEESSATKKLDELFSQNNGRQTGPQLEETDRGSSAHVATNLPLSAVQLQSSQSLLASSSSAYGPNSQAYQGHNLTEASVHAVSSHVESCPKTDGNRFVYTSLRDLIPGYVSSESDSIHSSRTQRSAMQRSSSYSGLFPTEELSDSSSSDDYFGFTFIARSGMHPAASQSRKPVQESRVCSQNEPTSSLKTLDTNHQALVEELARVYKYIEMAENIGKMNADMSKAIQLKLSKSDVLFGVSDPVGDQELTNAGGSYGDQLTEANKPSIPSQSVAGLQNSIRSLGGTDSHPDQLQRIEMAFSVDDGSKPRKQPSLTFAIKDDPVSGVTSGESSVAVGSPRQGDIVIDVSDRICRQYDILSKARVSGDTPSISPPDRCGIHSSIVVNQNRKSWSYFQKINEDVKNDESLPLSRADELALGHPSSYSGDKDEGSSSISGNESDAMDFHLLKVNDSAQSDLLIAGTVDSEDEDGTYTTQSLLDKSSDIDISNLTTIKYEDLEVGEELGSGTYGTVVHGKWRGIDVAIKYMKKNCFTGHSSELERRTIEFWREAEILSKLHHPNVVAFHGAVRDWPGGTAAFVTEFVANGSLKKALHFNDGQLDFRKRIIVAMDAAHGMEYLHSKNIVHYDLKCDNLFVDVGDPARPICKVGDFGLSKVKKCTFLPADMRGTIQWMAPELLDPSNDKVSEKIDVYSFGVVLWEILTGKQPYADIELQNILGGIMSNRLRPPVPSSCDPEWRALMEQCWDRDPFARPSFKEIARHLRAMFAACRHVMVAACTRKPSGQALTRSLK